MIGRGEGEGGRSRNRRIRAKNRRTRYEQMYANNLNDFSRYLFPPPHCDFFSIRKVKVVLTTCLSLSVHSWWNSYPPRARFVRPGQRSRRRGPNSKTLRRWPQRPITPPWAWHLRCPTTWWTRFTISTERGYHHRRPCIIWTILTYTTGVKGTLT